MKEKQPVQTELSTADTTRSSSSQDMQIEYEEYQTAFDYVSSSGGQSKEGEESSHISRLSKLAWIGCGDDTWVLELLGVGHVKIVKTADGKLGSSFPTCLLSSATDILSISAVLKVSLPRSIASFRRHRFITFPSRKLHLLLTWHLDLSLSTPLSLNCSSLPTAT